MPQSFRLDPPDAVRRVTYGVLVAALVGLAVLLGAGADLAERLRLLRVWAMSASALFAVAAPHVLLPDPHVPMLQRLNRSPRGLLGHQLRVWGAVVAAFAAPGPVLAFVAPGGFGVDLGVRALYLAAMLGVVLGVAGYAFVRCVGLGPVSQAWQEGRRGGWYRAMKENSPGGFAVPDGLVPAMFATTTAYVFGLGALVAAAYLGQAGELAWAWLPGAALATLAALHLARRHAAYDHDFYATTAFYAEVFRGAGGVRAAVREPLPFKALYWVPRRWKPTVWASLRQLDRRLPLGRYVALGQGLLWILFWQDVPGRTVAVYLAIFVVAKNAAVALLARPTLAPPPFQQMLRPAAGWLGPRLFVNLRWTPAFAASLALVALLDGGLGPFAVVAWTALDSFAALLAALIVTYGAEARYPRRFA